MSGDTDDSDCDGKDDDGDGLIDEDGNCNEPDGPPPDADRCEEGSGASLNYTTGHGYLYPVTDLRIGLWRDEHFEITRGLDTKRGWFSNMPSLAIYRKIDSSGKWSMWEDVAFFKRGDGRSIYFYPSSWNYGNWVSNYEGGNRYIMMRNGDERLCVGTNCCQHSNAGEAGAIYKEFYIEDKYEMKRYYFSPSVYFLGEDVCKPIENVYFLESIVDMKTGYSLFYQEEIGINTGIFRIKIGDSKVLCVDTRGNKDIVYGVYSSDEDCYRDGWERNKLIEYEYDINGSHLFGKKRGKIRSDSGGVYIEGALIKSVRYYKSNKEIYSEYTDIIYQQDGKEILSYYKGSIEEKVLFERFVMPYNDRKVYSFISPVLYVSSDYTGGGGGITRLTYPNGLKEEVSYNKNYLVTGKSGIGGCINCGGRKRLVSAEWNGLNAQRREYNNGQVNEYKISQNFVFSKPEEDKSYYSEGADNKVIRKYLYDSYGRLVGERIIEVLNGGEKVLYTIVNDYSLLTQGNCINVIEGERDFPIEWDSIINCQGGINIRRVVEEGYDPVLNKYRIRIKNYEYKNSKFPFLKTGEIRGDEKIYYEYDNYGKLRKITRDSLTTEFIEYDEYGNAIHIRNEDGTESYYEYDMMGRILSERKVGGNSEQLRKNIYGTNGLLKEERRLVSTSLGGIIKIYEYNMYYYEKYSGNEVEGEEVLFNRVKEEWNGLVTYLVNAEISRSVKSKKINEYDNMGRIVRVKVNDGSNNLIREERYEFYDSNDRLIRYIKETNVEGDIYKAIEEVYGKRCELDENIDGQRYEKVYYVRKIGERYQTITDYKTEVRCFDYMDRVRISGYIYNKDGAGEIIKEIKGRYMYDGLGNLIRYIDANGNETKYLYSGFSHLREVNSPDGGKIRYEYDNWGRMIKKSQIVNNLEKYKTEYKYDSIGRITNVVGFVDYEYDGYYLRRITENGVSTREYKYDSFGNIIEEKIIFGDTGGKEITVMYEYDLNGNITSIKTPLSSDSEKYSYLVNGYGEVNSITSSGEIVRIKDISYDAEGKIVSFEYKNGIKTNIRYRTGGIIERVEAKKGSGEDVFNRLYELDNRGRINDISTNGMGIGNSVVEKSRYNYSDEDWLIESDYSRNDKNIWEHRYEYDLNGNREVHTYKDYLSGIQKDENYYYIEGTNRLRGYLDPVKENGKKTDTSKWTKRNGLNSEFYNLLDECKKAAEEQGGDEPAIMKCEGRIGEKIRDIIKKYEIEESIFRSIVMNHSKINGSAVKMLKAKEIYNKNRSKPATDMIDFADYINKLREINLENAVKYQESVAYGLTVSPTQKVLYAYDEMGNVRVEAAYPTSNEDMPYGVLCYVHDALGRLTKVYIESRERNEFGEVDTFCDFTDNTHSKGLVLENRYDYRNRRVMSEGSYLLLPMERKYYIYDTNDRLISEIFYGVKSGNESGEKDLLKLREYVWLEDMPVAQVVYGKTEFYISDGGCQPGGGGGCSILYSEKENRFNWIRILFITVILVVGVIRIYSGRSNNVEKTALIVIVVLIMMAPFRYTPITRGIAFYYHNDHLNTPMKVSDEKGDIVWEVVSPHPFGEFEIESREVKISDYTGSSSDDITYRVSNPLRFPGQYDDSDTKDIRSLILSNANGLYYNWNRWYNPDTGRYIEVDRYKYPRLVNEIIVCRDKLSEKTRHRFTYAKNNPSMYSDITGLLCEFEYRCLLCFYLNSNDPNIIDISKSVLIFCDVNYTICKPKTPSMVGCGCTQEGWTKIYLTNQPECKDTCLIILHEIAHAYFGIKNEDEADIWAELHKPLCCPPHY